MKKNNETRTTKEATGLESNVAAALAYSLFMITGIIFLVVEKEDSFVRFHAMQSILLDIFLIVTYVLLFVSIVGIVLIPIWWIGVILIWLFMMLKAYQKEEFMLPYIGKMAKDLLKQK